MHRKGLANSSDLAPKSPNDQKLDMSPLCSKQSNLKMCRFEIIIFLRPRCDIIDPIRADVFVSFVYPVSHFQDGRTRISFRSLRTTSCTDSQMCRLCPLQRVILNYWLRYRCEYALRWQIYVVACDCRQIPWRP